MKVVLLSHIFNRGLVAEDVEYLSIPDDAAMLLKRIGYISVKSSGNTGELPDVLYSAAVADDTHFMVSHPMANSAGGWTIGSGIAKEVTVWYPPRYYRVVDFPRAYQHLFTQTDHMGLLPEFVKR